MRFATDVEATRLLLPLALRARRAGRDVPTDVLEDFFAEALAAEVFFAGALAAEAFFAGALAAEAFFAEALVVEAFLAGALVVEALVVLDFSADFPVDTFFAGVLLVDFPEPRLR
tara:strand:- start:151 stop:495 length:345 start_codon:yes stop_codon:yes gene_type:complete